MTRVLLVPDLPLERWPSMDRYAHRLHDWLESTDPGFEVRLAASIGDLTRDRANGRTSGGYPRWWAQDVDPTKLVLPGPLHEPQRYVARYVLYPWWLRALRFAAQPPGIQHVAGDVALRLMQRTRQHQLRRIHVLGPPPRIAARGAPVRPVARQVPDRRRQPHLESRIGALQPVVQPVGVAIHRGPALEGEIGDEEDSSHGKRCTLQVTRSTLLGARRRSHDVQRATWNVQRSS